MPPVAIRAIRSPACVYGELSWPAPSSPQTNYGDRTAMPTPPPSGRSVARMRARLELINRFKSSRSEVRARS
jgi:hypothetical protein